MSAEGTLILGFFSSPTRELEDYMSDQVQFVITAQEWDPSFEEVSPEGQGKGEPACPCIVSIPSSLTRAPSPPGPDGQPLPGVRPPQMDLQLQ